jgi:hypothetical protein
VIRRVARLEFFRQLGLRETWFPFRDESTCFVSWCANRRWLAAFLRDWFEGWDAGGLYL